jgi:hypothetical protein
LKHLRTATCPFANLPEEKRTQWGLIQGTDAHAGGSDHT